MIGTNDLIRAYNQRNDVAFDAMVWQIAEVIAALESANGLCRSAHEIATRRGTDTNWESFTARLRESLQQQHRVMYGIGNAEAAQPKGGSHE